MSSDDRQTRLAEIRESVRDWVGTVPHEWEEWPGKVRLLLAELDRVTKTRDELIQIEHLSCQHVNQLARDLDTARADLKRVEAERDALSAIPTPHPTDRTDSCVACGLRLTEHPGERLRTCLYQAHDCIKRVEAERDAAMSACQQKHGVHHDWVNAATKARAQAFAECAEMVRSGNWSPTPDGVSIRDFIAQAIGARARGEGPEHAKERTQAFNMSGAYVRLKCPKCGAESDTVLPPSTMLTGTLRGT